MRATDQPLFIPTTTRPSLPQQMSDDRPKIQRSLRIPVLVSGLLITGACNSLLTKWQDMIWSVSLSGRAGRSRPGMPGSAFASSVLTDVH